MSSETLGGRVVAVEVEALGAAHLAVERSETETRQKTNEDEDEVTGDRVKRCAGYPIPTENL